MRKLLYIVPAALVGMTVGMTPTPALALPTCEQEVRIRCSGYGVQGRPRLDIYYDSLEACVRAEQPLRCGTEPDPNDFSYEETGYLRMDLLRPTAPVRAV